MIKLLDVYPKPSALIKSETKVLAYLMTNPYIKETHTDFARHASESYERSRNSKRGFEFASHLDIWHTEIGGQKRSRKQRVNVRLILASLVVSAGPKDYAQITHCLSVLRCRAGGRYTILRKFHFDVAVGNNRAKGRLQRHPRFHLQYCGEMVPYMSEIGLRTAQLDQLHPRLSEPRIFYTPMSLALMLDMSLREFPDAESMKFRSTGEWRGIVHEHESLMLRPFFENCLDVIDQSGPIQTLADGFYLG
jgi:hypothetical protein